jgi:hypothetical protein
MSRLPPTLALRVTLFYVGLAVMVFGAFRLGSARGLAWSLMGGGFVVVMVAAAITGQKKAG